MSLLRAMAPGVIPGLVLAAGFCLLGSAPTPETPDVITAREIRVVGPDGAVGARLRVDELAGPRLELHDRTGRIRVALTVHAWLAPGLELLTETGRHAVQVRDLNGDPTITLHDDAGVERLSLVVSGPDEEATLRITSKTGRIRWPDAPATPEPPPSPPDP